MKKRNVCVLLAAALSCSLVLTACGGDTTTSTPGAGLLLPLRPRPPQGPAALTLPALPAVIPSAPVRAIVW